jgi:ribosomal subunit interface protein
MQVSLQGRHVDVSDAFRGHVEETLANIFEKYFGDPIDAAVTIAREAHLFTVSVSAHIGQGLDAIGSGEAEQPYAAFDAAAEHLAKRLRRHKRRLRDHRRSTKTVMESLSAPHYILAAGHDEDEEAPEAMKANGAGEDQPLVIAEMTTEIPTLTVSQAVMRLDLGDQDALLFHNSSHGGLNLVHRREDGNIGWIDPQGNARK